MQTLRSQTIKMNNLANNLQIMKEYTMTSSLKNTMKSMEQPKKYYWSCKCSSFWHKLLEVEFGIELFAEPIRNICLQQERQLQIGEESGEVLYKTMFEEESNAAEGVGICNEITSGEQLIEGNSVENAAEGVVMKYPVESS